MVSKMLTAFPCQLRLTVNTGGMPSKNLPHMAISMIQLRNRFCTQLAHESSALSTFLSWSDKPSNGKKRGRGGIGGISMGFTKAENAKDIKIGSASK